MILRSVRVNTQIVTGQSRSGLLEFHLRDEDDQKRLALNADSDNLRDEL